LRQNSTKMTFIQRRKGFTAIELLIVIAIIGMMLIMIPRILRPPCVYSYRTQCANNIHQILVSLVIYADENDGLLPIVQNAEQITVLGKDTTNTILRNMGIDTERLSRDSDGDIEAQDIFYCCANKVQQTFRHRYWKYTEDSRATGYFWMLDTAQGRERIKGSGDKRWIKKIDVKRASKAELISDIVISDETNFSKSEYPDGNFARCPSFVLGTEGYDSTNHLIKDKKPAGGNVGFADGNVEWRSFGEMERRYGKVVTQWW